MLLSESQVERRGLYPDTRGESNGTGWGPQYRPRFSAGNNPPLNLKHLGWTFLSAPFVIPSVARNR